MKIYYLYNLYYQFTMRHIQKTILITLFINSFLAILVRPLEYEQAKFPKKLWAYWDSGLKNSMLITRLCINNMAHYAHKSGWEFNFVTDENITKFLNPSYNIQEMFKTSKFPLQRQHKGDLLRYGLLHENGGMWIDANSFFIANFSWLDNLSKQVGVYNKLSKTPEVLMFTYNNLYGINKTTVVDAETGQEVYLFPGLQIWAIISMPKSTLLGDVIKQVRRHLQLGFPAATVQYNRQGLIFSTEADSYFFLSNQLFQILLHHKQKELNVTPMDGVRYAVQYYKLWTIESTTSAYYLMQHSNWQPVLVAASVLYQSVEELRQENPFPMYFVKLNANFYPTINFAVQNTVLASCIGLDTQPVVGSIAEQFLLSMSENQPEVIALRQFYAQKELLGSYYCPLLEKGIDKTINIMRSSFLLLVVLALIFGGFMRRYFYSFRTIIEEQQAKAMIHEPEQQPLHVQ